MSRHTGNEEYCRFERREKSARLPGKILRPFDAAQGKLCRDSATAIFMLS